MTTTHASQWHPFNHTEEEDLAILTNGADTGWHDENGRPAPWPQDFLDPTAGWAPASNTSAEQTNTENPPF